MMYSLETMLEITGNANHADRLERIAFNALPTQCTSDFRARQYFQQTNQVLVNKGARDFFWMAETGSFMDSLPAIHAARATFIKDGPSSRSTYGLQRRTAVSRRWSVLGTKTMMRTLFGPPPIASSGLASWDFEFMRQSLVSRRDFGAYRSPLLILRKLTGSRYEISMPESSASMSIEAPG